MVAYFSKGTVLYRVQKIYFWGQSAEDIEKAYIYFSRAMHACHLLSQRRDFRNTTDKAVSYFSKNLQKLLGILFLFVFQFKRLYIAISG